MEYFPPSFFFSTAALGNEAMNHQDRYFNHLNMSFIVSKYNGVRGGIVMRSSRMGSVGGLGKPQGTDND